MQIQCRDCGFKQLHNHKRDRHLHKLRCERCEGRFRRVLPAPYKKPEPVISRLCDSAVALISGRFLTRE